MCIIDSALKFRTFQRPQEYYYRDIRSTYICETLEPVKHIPHTYYLYNWSPVENRKGSIRSLLSVRLSVRSEQFISGTPQFFSSENLHGVRHP